MRATLGGLEVCGEGADSPLTLPSVAAGDSEGVEQVPAIKQPGCRATFFYK